MSEQIQLAQQSIIDDEILRARIRTLTGKPESKPASPITRFSTNPLAPLIVGFLLTGVVGTFLTAYYTDRQKGNDAARQAQEKSLEDQRIAAAQTLEYSRKQNLMEIENQQHLNAKALEDQRAKELREAEAARAAHERDIQYARSQINVVEDRKIEQAKLLEIFVKYISSDDPSQRTFGYEMFVSFGRGDLAAKIISLKGDPAGRTTLIAIQTNSAQNATTKQFASQGLVKITDVQLKRILAVDAFVETGRADGTSGAALFRFAPPSVLGPSFEAYMAHPEAKYKNELTPYLSRARANELSVMFDESFQTLAKEKLQSDPILISILESRFKEAYLYPALKQADELGVQTVLGLAAFFDMAVHTGPASVKRLSDDVSQKLNGSPKTGVDEKDWIKSFLEGRKTKFQRRTSTEAIRNAFIRRVDFFLAQAEKNNWDLVPPFEIRGHNFTEAP